MTKERIHGWFQLLRMRAGYEAVNFTTSDTNVRVVGRVPKDQVRQWTLVMNSLLEHAEGRSWTIDISKHYFRKDGQMRFSWRMLIQAEDINAIVGELATAVEKAPRPKFELQEVPLVGATAERNAPSSRNRGKGAHSALRPVVGPMAARAMSRGSN